MEKSVSVKFKDDYQKCGVAYEKGDVVEGTLLGFTSDSGRFGNNYTESCAIIAIKDSVIITIIIGSEASIMLN